MTSTAATSPRLARLYREFRIADVPTSHNHRRVARQTCAGKVLRRLLQARGHDHLHDVLMTITETKPNKHGLIAPVIMAVSDVLRAHPEWFGDRWLQLFEHKPNRNGHRPSLM